MKTNKPLKVDLGRGIMAEWWAEEGEIRIFPACDRMNAFFLPPRVIFNLMKFAMRIPWMKDRIEELEKIG